jgi:hypothetical protein
MDLSADIAYQIAHAPDVVTVTLGASSTSGLLDIEEASELADLGLTAAVRTTTCYLQPGTLAGLAPDSVLVIGGVSYVVRDVPPVRPDGLLAVRLAAVTA